jgi:protein phosphatase 1B
LACDGIWDVMTNENLRDYLSSRLKITDDLVKISNDILDMCLNKGSRDNMSIIIVTLPGAPKVTQDEVDKDISCNEKIETRIKEMIKESSKKVEFSQVISKISEEKWNEFPPGGGVQAKQSVIEETFNRLVVKSSEDEPINPGSFVLHSPL